MYMKKETVKKIISMFCAAAMMISLASCGSNANEDASAKETIKTTEETTTEETTTIPEPAYEECPDAMVRLVKQDVMELSGSYFESYDFYVQNTGEKAITGFTIAKMLFDEDFLPMSKEYTTDEIDGNIAPGKLFYMGFGDIKDNHVEKAAYCVATLISVTYRDGSEWKMENADEWADDVYKNYTLDMWRDNINILSEDAEKAEKNEYLESIYDISVFEGSNGAALNFHSPANYDPEKITKYSVYIIFYNKSGEYLNLQGFSVDNDAAKVLNEDPGSGYTLQSQVTVDNFGSARAVIGSILFKDGTQWENPYLGTWQCYNSIDTYLH